MFSLPISAIKTLEKLIEYIQTETIDPIEDSIKNVKKNFKASNYLALATILLLSGASLVLAQMFSGQYLLQSLIYFSLALLCILMFSFIAWRILK